MEDLSKDLTTLNDTVTAEADSELKNYIINYVGEKTDPDDEQVTVEMIIDVMAKDFPQLILCISEENWVRGYQQALVDVEQGERLFNEELSKSEE